MNTTADTGRRKGYMQTTANQITLDEFCDSRELKPELIKIDTEGAELNILKGAIEVLRRHKPTIILSVHPRTLSN
jgi:FkbM family methyltransferase